MKKRMISTLLVLCMVLGMLPPTAFADNTAQTEPSNVISTDGYYTSIIDENDALWTWGDSIYNDNQLGNGTTDGSNVPVKVIDDAVTVVREKQFSEGSNAVITTDGSLWMWGQNNWGQLGTGTRESSSVPIKVLDNVASVSLGGMRTAAVKKDGSLWAWGNAQGSVWCMLGNGTQNGSLVPIKIMDGVASVSCGENHIAALKTDGSLWLWGNGDALGRGNIPEIPKDEKYHSPVPIKILDNVTYVSAGNCTTVAIKADGSLWAWGGNGTGELGNNSTETAYYPIKVMDGVSSVTLCNDSSYYPAVAAIKNDGSLWMWGNNNCGRLGNGTTEASRVPVKIMDDVVSVSMGASHTAAIKNDGSLWTWGENDYGQLGTGTKQNSLIPVKVMDDVAVVALETKSTFVGKKDKTVWAFGSNSFGYLGLGYNGDPVTTPTQIENLTVKVPGSVTPPGPGPGTDPDPDNPPKPTGSPEITNLYPANGSTFNHAGTSGDAFFHITFDREVPNVHGGRPGLDFSVGTLEVHRASDDKVVYAVTESPFTAGTSSHVSLYGSSAPFTAISIDNIFPELDYDTEYYVTMPAGFVKMADGAVSPEIKRGEWGVKTANLSVPEKPPTQPIVVKQPGNFKFTSDILAGRDDKNIQYDYNYDESWFLQNSTVYQHDLVKMSIRVALAAGGAKGKRFDGEDIVPYSSANIKSLMTDLGYTNFHDAYVEPEYNTIGYAISSKNVRSEDGAEFSIIMVAIRGAGYFQEWGGDFNVGMTKEHDGFRLAANEVIRGLREYLSDYEDNLLDTKKIWITGFSRGAATTNLVAARLNDGWIDGIEKQNVYAFCFACPQNIDNSKKANVADPTKKEDLTSNYTNIINIVNPIDAIPKVVMSSKDWEFSRYGKTYYLPALGVINLSAYQSLAKNMKEKYQTILEPYGIQAKTYIPEKADATYLRDRLADLLAYFYVLPEAYVQDPLGQNMLMPLAANALGEESDKNMAVKLKNFANLLKETKSLVNGKRKSALVTAVAYMLDEAAEIMFSHYGELYLSWLDSLNGASDYTQKPKYRIVYINCPVDVEIHDDHDILVGQIRGDGIVNITNDIGILTDEDGQKIAILPFDTEYTIQLTATDRGEVTYTVAERSIESGTIERVVSYYQVDVKSGDKLIGTVENLSTATVANYPLIVNDVPAKPTIVQNSDDISLHEVSVSSSGDGNVSGGGYYISGEFAKVTAVANSGSIFLGWYLDNDLVSADKEYRFLVSKDVNIVAKFTQHSTIPDVPINPTPSYPSGGSTGNISTQTTYSITISNVAGGSVTAVPKSASKGSTVTLTAIPNEGYELASLTVTNGSGNEIVPSDKGNGKYIFTMPATDVTVSATFAPVSTVPTIPTGDTSNDETHLFPFTDVLKTDWFYGAVEYVFNNDLMSGTAPYTFDPQGKMNRAMVWTVLGRMSDADVDGSDSVWYAKAQEWAIANNVSDGTNPNNSISRQELMTMLWRYIGSPDATADLSKFSDNGSVADWADAAMRWAVSTGLIVGDNGHLNPTGDAKRCEVAMIFMRFCETIIK